MPKHPAPIEYPAHVETPQVPDSFLSACEGFGLAFEAGEVEQLAQFLGFMLEVNKTTNLTAIRDGRGLTEAIETFRSLDLDAACVVAYGQILKPEVLEAPRMGCLNLHGSLLPRWRGARW